MFSNTNFNLAAFEESVKSCCATAESKYDLPQETHQSKVRELALLVYASASRLGVTDQKLIFKLINTFVNAILLEVKWLTNDESVKVYLQELSDLIQTFKLPDTDCLLNHFFQEKYNELKTSDMATRLIALKKWKSNDLHDWMGIYRFMSDDKFVLQYMDQLEEELQQFVAKFPSEWQFPRRDDGRFELPNDNPYACYKLLSNFMYEWALENGFKQSVKLIGNVPTTTFYSALASQSFIKDSGFGGAHGILVHGKQWYAVIEHYKKTQFLKSSPLEIYQRLGDNNLLPTEKSLVRNPWDILFDATRGTSCTTPETLTRYVRDNKSRWPLLSGTVSRQRSKKIDGKTSTETLKNKHAHDARDGVVVRPFRSKL